MLIMFGLILTVSTTMWHQYLQEYYLTLECTATIPTPAVVTATDNCSTATVTYLEQTVDGSCVGNKVVTRTWIATDACNNRIQHVQTINLIDSKPPVFNGILPSNIVLTCDTLPMASTLTATDNCGNATVTFSESKVDGSCSSQYDLLRTWTAEDACGNISTHIQQIKVTCFVEIFNAVSPNGDGKNDFFLIEGIDCFPKNSLQIFNRWGVNVFEINGYDNVKNVFAGFSDGRASISRSKLLPTGTYFYILNYEFSVKGSTPQNKEKSGYLYIQSK